MKRLTSFLLAVVLLLSLNFNVLAAEGAKPADQIDSTTVWSYLDDNSDPAGNPSDAGYNRTAWTAVDFDDSAWKTGSGGFGAKNGGSYDGAAVTLAGCPGDESNYPTYYFRTKVNVTNASAVTAIKGSISYDDAAIIYINGVKAAAFNEEGCDSNSSYSANKANATDHFEITDSNVLNALKNGENVVAVELHNHYDNSSDVWFAMNELSFSTDTVLLDAAASWKYLDDNTDPAGDSSEEGYDRTAWTAENFDISGWKTAKGSFGSKRGGAAYDSTHTAATVLEGCDGSNDTPAYFFRTTFNISNLERYTKLTGSLEYDDGVIVYINGQRVAAGYDNACDENGISLGHGFDANLQYGGSNQGPETLNISLLDLSILHEGENTIAVELHNGRKTSSDVWFAFGGLFLSAEEVIYQNNISLSVGADESKMNFTWYSPLANDACVSVSENPDMTNGNTFSAFSSIANDGQYSCKAVATGLKHSTTYYYQLSNNGKKGQIYSFTTGGDGAFSFALVGDPQIGAGNTASDTAGWEDTLNTMAGNELFSDISFLVSTGDQVNSASDEAQYDGYLEHNALFGLPVATAIGNHDSSSNAYAQHFNIANESDAYGVTSAGGDYYFVYNNTLFLVLNSNSQSEEAVNGHKAFMQAAVEATKDSGITWKVAVFHHTLFTVASHAHDSYIENENGFKKLIIPVLEELDIDAVLTGHDHVYCRTYMMDGTTPITEFDGYEYGNGTDAAPTAVNDPDGILYITANSGSGSKTYGILNETFPFSAVQNQENSANISKVTVSDSAFTVTTYRVSDMSVIDSFTIKKNTAAQEPTYTPVQAGDVRVKGFFNADDTVQLELSARYNSGAMNADGGSLEIVAYNPDNGYAYAVSGVKGKLIAVDLNGNTDGDKVQELTGKEYDIKGLVSGFSYGDITSVAVFPDGKKLAVAIQAENYADKGVAALFSCAPDGSLTLLSTVEVGVQPDMITFADDSTILTADEGEPRLGENGTDPKGSVSIVKIGQDHSLTANTVYFDGFDEKRDELTKKGVLIQKDTQPSTDFEPEYIAVINNQAFISLQEANSIAVLDIAKGEFKGVYPLGFQDYSKTEIDLQKNDTIELKNYPNVYGIKMPDGISVTEIGGKIYLLTANEGDSRADWTGLDNEYENVTSPTGNVTLDKKVVWFNTNMWDGLDSDKAYVFGGRSFSMYEATDDGLTLVFDSGSDFEKITSDKLPDYFNTSNDKTSIDNRSGKKGPEPESIVTGVIDNRTFAFAALERIGGIMVYDITDPANVKFANYINSREFDEVIKGDVSPEGLCFIPAADSKNGKNLLLAACEVSGTLAVYQCDYKQSETNNNTIINGTGGPGSQSSTTVKTNPDGSTTTTTIQTNPDGSQTVKETTTATDTKGKVTGVTEKTVIENVAENTTATVTVRKDGDDKVKTSRAEVVATVDADTTKVTLAGAVVDQVEATSGTSNVTVTLAVKNEEGDTKYTVKVATKNLEAGNKLYVYKIDEATGDRVLVNNKLYTVSEDGSITFNTKQNADFVLVNKVTAAAINKAIKKTITPARAATSVKSGKSTRMTMNPDLNLANVKKITYTTNKASVASVSADGKITAKRAGVVYVTAKVTLKNGYTKTVKMKVTVK